MPCLDLSTENKWSPLPHSISSYHKTCQSNCSNNSEFKQSLIFLMMAMLTICIVHLPSQIACTVIISLWDFHHSLPHRGMLLTTDKAFFPIIGCTAQSQGNRDIFKHTRLEFENTPNLPLKGSLIPETTKLSSPVFFPQNQFGHLHWKEFRLDEECCYSNQLLNLDFKRGFVQAQAPTVSCEF